MTTTRSGFTKLAAICIAILLGSVIWGIGLAFGPGGTRMGAPDCRRGHFRALDGRLGFLLPERDQPARALLVFQIVSCLLIFALIAREQQEDNFMRFTELSCLVITAGLIAIPTLMSPDQNFRMAAAQAETRKAADGSGHAVRRLPGNSHSGRDRIASAPQFHLSRHYLWALRTPCSPAPAPFALRG